MTVWMALGLLAAGLFPEEPQAVLRIEVRGRGAVLAGVRLTVDGREFRTGVDGMATVATPLRPVEITAAHEGFHPARLRLAVDEAREWHVVIELEPAQEVEEQITVFATRTDRRLQDQPMRVEVLGAEEIEEKVMMTPGDIVMMLNEMGGMRVQTTSPALGAASVRMQGMRGRYTRFLADGLPLFGQQGAGLGLLQIPPMDLGQVEVIKGVSSALYGAGAMAGVVNLIARRPAAEPAREFLLNQSTLGATDAAAFLASRLNPRWGASLLAGGHRQLRNDRDGDGWADLAGYERGIARPRLFWDSGEGRSGFLTAGITLEDRNGGMLPGRALPATGAAHPEALSTQRYDAGASHQFLVRTRYAVSLRAAGSSQHHDHLFGDTRERDRHDMIFAEAAMRAVFGRHTGVVGLALDRDAYRARDYPAFNYVFTTPGIFVQDDVDLASWLSVSAGARADFHSRYGSHFSPRLAALVRAGRWTSRFSAGRGFSAPTPLTEETEAAGLARLRIPLPLKAERGSGVSVDLTRGFGPASVTATIFAARVRNPIRVERSIRYELTNAGHPIRNQGFELLGTWRKAPLSVTANYAYVYSREIEQGVPVDTPLTPRHSAGLVGMWEWEERGRIGLEFYYTGRQRLEVNPYRTASEPYVIAGLLIERRVGSARLFLNAENLTNVCQTRWDPLLRPHRGADGRWTVDAWAPLDGRVFNGGVRFRF